MSKDLLVVKCGIHQKRENFEEIHEALCRMKETGVILLPPHYYAIVVPDDVAIKVKGKTDKCCENCKYGPRSWLTEACFWCWDKHYTSELTGWEAK